MADDPTDSIDVANPDRVAVGVTRGESDLEVGKPHDYPDRADVSLKPVADDRVLLTVDVIAGDHGTGHADVELSVEEAGRLRDLLDETVRWMRSDS